MSTFGSMWLENDSLVGEMPCSSAGQTGQGCVAKTQTGDLVPSLSSLPVEVARSKRPARELRYRIFGPLSSVLCSVAEKVPLGVHGVQDVLYVSI